MRPAAADEFGATASGLLSQALASDWLLRVGLALLIAGLGMWLARLLSRGLDRVLGRFGVEKILRDFLRNLAYAIGLIVVFVAALDALGVPTTSLLAVLGAAGLAIGLALKDSLSNIASGVMLIVLRPFRAGDAVVLAGQEGIVEQVRIFQTVLRTYQNHDVILPNSQITAAPIVNYTARAQRRIDLPVGIGYDDDLGRAREVLLQLAAANPKVLAEPAPDVLVSDLGESSVNLVLRAWVDTPEFVTARSELTEGITREFSRAGVSIPYPQRSLHVYHHDADGRPLAQIAAAVDDPDRG
jgi:small conductance mechanosensitive channel